MEQVRHLDQPKARRLGVSGRPEIEPDTSAPGSEMRVGHEDSDMRQVEYTIGVGVTGSMSGSASSPWLASQLPRGSNSNKNVVLIELFTWNDGEAQTYWQYRYENQQRSLLGVANDSGFRKAEVDYGEYGLAQMKKILWDGRDPSYFYSVVPDVDNLVVTLTAAGGLNQPVTSDMLGALARVVTPSQSPYVYFGRVVNVDPGADEFTIEDPTGALYTAMDTYDGVLTVFDHHDADINSGQVHTAGLWTANPTYGSSVTTFTNANNDFPTYAQGWTLQPDARYPVFYPIVSAAAGSITVAGDVTGTLPDVTENDVYYFIIPPAGVDKTNGALSLAPTEPLSRYLAFQYLYLPPVVGVFVDDERVADEDIYGRQAGDNLASQYYCWHRFYQPDTGRWTTPDPAMSPWTSLADYCEANPQNNCDNTGLAPKDKGKLKGWAPTGIDETKSGTGDGWWSVYWSYQIGNGPYQQNARLYQRIGIRTTFTCCCEEKQISLWSFFLEVFAPQAGQDHQGSRDLKAVGNAECAKINAGPVKVIQESRVNSVSLHIAPQAVLNELQNSSTVFFDMTTALDLAVKAANNGQNSMGQANSPTEVPGLFEKSRQRNLAAFRGDYGEGSRADYGISYRAEYECPAKAGADSVYKRSCVKTYPSPLLKDKMSYEKTDP